MYKFHKVERAERMGIAKLFLDVDDSMITSYLQGYMGDGYVDKFPDPTVAMIVSGNFTFFGGDPYTYMAKELARYTFSLNSNEKTTAIFSDKAPGWEKILMSIPENHPKPCRRFGFLKRNYRMDPKYLISMMGDLPKGYTLVPFDKNLYLQAIKNEWSKPFCETFASAYDYLSRGLGYAVTKDGKLVSGTSTMTVCDGGAEIQVATHPGFRKKGLAIPSAAAFILECFKRGINPNWDAPDEVSLHMALRLGFQYKSKYKSVRMHISPNRPIKTIPKMI